MSKQSLIAVPTTLEDFQQVRFILSKVVQELDTLLGYRGETSTSQTLTTLTTTLAELSELVETLPIANWNQAFLWGDHSQAQYLKNNTSFTELVDERILANSVTSLNAAKVATRLTLGI